MITNETALSENLDAWDSIAEMHARGSGAEFYRIEQWLAGECRLGEWEIEELGPVEGKNLLHLQCHIGTDTLEWARQGAKVTGLDFSPKAIAEAKRFAKILGIDAARFFVAPVHEAPQQLPDEQFDILYTGRGAICWLPDLNEWAQICQQLLKPGGVLYMEETHPVFNMLDVIETSEGRILTPKYNLFKDGPVSETAEGSYADRDAKTGKQIYHCWDYRFDTILNALQGHGFGIDFLHERELAFCKPWDDSFFVEVTPYYWRMRDDLTPIPMSFTLRATLKDG